MAITLLSQNAVSVAGIWDEWIAGATKRGAGKENQVKVLMVDIAKTRPVYCCTFDRVDRRLVVGSCWGL